MRLAYYAGASSALAATVVLSAFHQRANFYSALVYLSQSNFCLLVLVNFIYILYGTFMYGLQRLCFGPLRPVEVEQLSDRAWIAITETCLAMTIFREELGAWFLVMFTALVTGKVWGWIGDGRVEVFEQQPPANPRLFHTRLVFSLGMSLIYDYLILHYTTSTVIYNARPNMMVMFLFEFAVLTVSSLRTIVRYGLGLNEARIVRKQTQERLAARRLEVQQQRDEMIRQREQDPDTDASQLPPLPNPDDIDEIDIEVPGWESKGLIVLCLELATDCLKLMIYLAFFSMLLMFYGLPVHIMRDLYVTGHAFFKRCLAVVKYRRAIQSMNRYPDATSEDLTPQNICIICREDMRPWDPDDTTAVERTRPKKLPCGHILHFGCLKSWLERQQVCPTCRSPVVAARNHQPHPMPVPPLGVAAAGVQAQQPANNGVPQGADAADQRPGNNARMFNLGPLRLQFIRRDLRDLMDPDGGLVPPREPANPPAPAINTQPTIPATNPDGLPDIHARLQTMRNQMEVVEQALQREAASLQTMGHELNVYRLLTQELANIRQRAARHDLGAQHYPHTRMPPPPTNQGPNVPQLPPLTSYPQRFGTPTMSRHAALPNSTAIPSGSPDLPEGVVIPPGWSLLPLQRVDPVVTPPAVSQAQATHGAHPPLDPASLRAALQRDANTVGVEPTPTATIPHVAGEASSSRDPPPVAQSREQMIVQEDSPETSADEGEMPNWGGSAQLFGNTEAKNREPEGRNSEPATDETENPVMVRLPTQNGGSSRRPETEARDEQPSTSDKGKGKAVTVEDGEEVE